MFHTPAHKNAAAPAGQIVTHVGPRLVSSNPNPQPARRAMDNELAKAIASGFEDPLDRDEELAAWQHLHDTGIAYELESWYGDMARALVGFGVIRG